MVSSILFGQMTFGQIWQCLVFNQEVVEIPQSSASVSVSAGAAMTAFYHFDFDYILRELNVHNS